MKKENLLFLLLALFLVPLSAAAQDQKYWLSGGQNTSNTRHAATETRLSVANAGSLKKN